MDKVKVCLIDEINRCSGSPVTISDHEEGTGEVMQRCLCQPVFSQQPTPFPRQTGLCKQEIDCQNQKSWNTRLLKMKQRMGLSTQYGFISLMCCVWFRAEPRHGIEEQIPAITTKSKTKNHTPDTYFAMQDNSRHPKRTKYIENGDWRMLFSPSGKT